MRPLWMAAMALLAALPVAAREDGAAVFDKHCVVCHQPKGEGAPGFAPRLAGTLAERSRSEAARRYLAQLIVSGMMGPIVSGGEKFNEAMPSLGTLTDDEIVAVLGYLLQDLNGLSGEELVTPADVLQARRRVMSPSEVRRLRERL